MYLVYALTLFNQRKVANNPFEQLKKTQKWFISGFFQKKQIKRELLNCCFPAVTALCHYHSYLWLLYCKMPLCLSSPVSGRPLTPSPLFYWPPGSNTVNAVSWYQAPDPRPQLCRSLIGQARISPEAFFMLDLNPSPPPGPPCSSSHVNCLAVWCSSNLSRHYPPLLSAPPRPRLHSFTLLIFAPSPHNFMLSQQIAGSPWSIPFTLLIPAPGLFPSPAHFVRLP